MQNDWIAVIHFKSRVDYNQAINKLYAIKATEENEHVNTRMNDETSRRYTQAVDKFQRKKATLLIRLTNLIGVYLT